MVAGHKMLASQASEGECRSPLAALKSVPRRQRQTGL